MISHGLRKVFQALRGRLSTMWSCSHFAAAIQQVSEKITGEYTFG
jgi:hypothetical protein